jgi:soluble lytic murein transglycosylase-like protein
MPPTAFELDPSLRYADLFDRDTNLRLGFRYLRQMLDKYDGDLRLALLAYNRGPGTVDGILRAGGDPANGYARAVLSGVR